MSEFLRVVESPLIEEFGWALVHFVWQAALLAGLMAALLIPLRKTSSHVKYIVHCGALSVMAVCPLVTWWLGSTAEEYIAVASSQVNAEAADGRQIAAEHSMSNDVMSSGQMVAGDARDSSGRSILRSPAEDAAVGTGPDLVPSNESAEASIPWNKRFHRKLRPAIPWMVGVWMLGVVLLSVRLLVGWRVVQRLRRLAVTPAAAEWQTCLRDVAERMRISRPVMLLESVWIEIPTVIGWLRPVILIPASILMNLTPRQLEAVLAHELAHIRRHDYLVNLIQSAIETLLFYHPAVWWLSRLIRNEREHCCDDLALSFCDNRVTYVSALAALEELRSSPALTVAATGGSLLARVRRISGLSSDGGVWSPWAVLCLVACSLIVIAAMSMLNVPNLAHASSEQSDNATRWPFVAEFADGKTIELVGITKNTAPANEGWRADGVPIGDIGDWNVNLVMQEGETRVTSKVHDARADTDARDLLLRFRGLKDRRPSIHFTLPSGATTEGQWMVKDDPFDLRYPIGRTQVFKVAKQPNGVLEKSVMQLDWKPSNEDPQLTIGISDEPWGRPVSIQPDGEINDPIQPDEPYAKTYELVEIVGASAIDKETGATWITIRQPPTKVDPADRWHAYDFEFYAVDTDGDHHTTGWRQEFPNGKYDLAVGSYGLSQPLPENKTLSHYEYRLRPYRHWVTFKNVSLQPGEKTNVKVQVISLAIDDGKPIKVSGHVRDIHDNELVAAGSGNGVDDLRLSSIAVQINQIGQAVLQKLQKETADFLNNSQRQQLVADLKFRLAEQVSVPLAPPDFEKILSEIGNSSRGPNRIKFAREDIFMTHFALLEWRIWVGMDPLELTPEEMARREAQRKWFRAYIKAQPAPYEGRQIYSTKSGKRVESTFLEYDLLQYEELLTDPTYPFLFFPFRDDEFEGVKVSLQSTSAHGFASKCIYDQYDKAHRSKVEQRWHYSDDKGSAIWGDGTEYLKGFADDTVAEADLPDAGPPDMEPETKKQDQTPAKKVYTSPPNDALVKLLGTNVNLNAARKNSAGLQYTTIDTIPDQEWEPVALEEAYNVVLTGMKENFGRIKTWSGECQEVMVTRDKSVMKEKSHLVRFAWDVPTSKGGAVQTASKDWNCPVEAFDSQKPSVFDRMAQSDSATEAAQQFHAQAIFYTPFFMGRQNKLHWDRIAMYLKHFQETETPESERFVIAYRAKNQSSGMWRLDTVYTGIQDRLLVSQIISGLQGFNVLRETGVYVLPDGNTFIYDEVLQSYSENDGVFVPAERMKREFEPHTENLRSVHLQRITRSVVNQPLEPLPELTPLPPEPPRVFPTDAELY